LTVLLAAVLACATGVPGRGAAQPAGAAAPPAVPYPEGYRDWLHVTSMVIHDRAHPLYEAFGGIHHVYVNSVGARAAREGGAYPDGSILVFDLLEARVEGGAMTEGARKFIGVMVKDRAAYAATGGWGFEAFRGDSRDQRVVTDARAQCFACHQGARATDHVFARYRR
jgi:hypothetical protein